MHAFRWLRQVARHRRWVLGCVAGLGSVTAAVALITATPPLPAGQQTVEIAAAPPTPPPEPTTTSRPLSSPGEPSLLPAGTWQVPAADPAVLAASPPPAASVAPQRASSGRIAVIVTDLGLARAITAAAIDWLSPEITLAFSPYGRDSGAEAARARRDGHQTLIQLPIAKRDGSLADSGPMAVRPADVRKNEDRLAAILAVAAEPTGVVGWSPTPRTAALGSAWAPLMAGLRAHGLIVIDATEAGGGEVVHAAATTVVPAAAADILIGRGADAATIDKRLRAAEQVARERGSAVVVISASPRAIQRLAAWAAELAGTDLALVPIANVVTAPSR